MHPLRFGNLLFHFVEIAVEVNAQFAPGALRRVSVGHARAVKLIHGRKHIGTTGHCLVRMAGDVDDLGIGKAFQQRTQTATAHHVFGQIRFARTAAMQKTFHTTFIKRHHLLSHIFRLVIQKVIVFDKMEIRKQNEQTGRVHS